MSAELEKMPKLGFGLMRLPAWEIKQESDIDRIFDEQCERAGVDYFDFYLLHSIEDGSNYEIYEKYDCFSWGLKKKEAAGLLGRKDLTRYLTRCL